MTNSIKDIHAEIKEIIMAAMGRGVADEVLPAVPAPAFSIETPADPSFGDFATNAAMVSAKAFRMPPRRIAEAICERMDFTGTLIERAEVAKKELESDTINEESSSEAEKPIAANNSEEGAN